MFFSFSCRLNITFVVFWIYVLLTYCTTNNTAIMFLGLFISSFHHLVTMSTLHNGCANWPLITHTSYVPVEAFFSLPPSLLFDSFAYNIVCTYFRIHVYGLCHSLSYTLVNTSCEREMLAYLLLHHNIDRAHIGKYAFTHQGQNK